MPTKSKRRICLFTGTRAEYGLLRPLISAVQSDAELEMRLVVSGMHLAPEFGFTLREIEADGVSVEDKIEILLSSDSAVGMAKATGLGLISFAECLARLQPDIAIVLGDRFESLAFAMAAAFLQIPVAHIAGGEVTLGAIDESIRHAITKFSHIHFPSTDLYRSRVIQLGESPELVFNVGALGVDCIDQTQFIPKEEIESDLGFEIGRSTLLVTFHPATNDSDSAADQFATLLRALEGLGHARVVFTKANADPAGRFLNKMVDDFVAVNHRRCAAFTSLGQRRYLSLMKLSSVVVGNSSSGLVEAPMLGVPTVNIGSRQQGRLRAESVIDCAGDEQQIAQAILRAESPIFLSAIREMRSPYGSPGVAARIVRQLKTIDLTNIQKKKFHEVPSGGAAQGG